MDFMVMKYNLLCLATAQAHLTHSVFEQHVESDDLLKFPISKFFFQ